MDNDISVRISKEWGVSPETIEQYASFYTETIKPIIKTNYLSHLVTTVENMVNDRRIRNYFVKVAEAKQEGLEKLRGLLASRTFRLYSIVLEPVNLKRRATTRYHHSGGNYLLQFLL